MTLYHHLVVISLISAAIWSNELRSEEFVTQLPNTVREIAVADSGKLLIFQSTGDTSLRISEASILVGDDAAAAPQASGEIKVIKIAMTWTRFIGFDLPWIRDSASVRSDVGASRAVSRRGRR